MNQDTFKKSYKRRKTKSVMVGSVKVGGNAPISVQTMTNTNTSDVNKTLNQINLIYKAGADIVRVSCPDKDSTQSLKEIVKKSPLPIVADIHFHYLRAVEAASAGAACLRINPGNIGNIKRVHEVIKSAKDNNCSIRIGVNAGSLEKQILQNYKEPTSDALVESALLNAKILEDNDFTNFKISVKASNILTTCDAYEKLSEKVDYPLHIGITEAGGLIPGTVKSALGLGSLLWKGIGDTIRVSLSAEPVEEVKVGFEILKSLNLRSKGVNIISCPSCARQQFEVIESVQEIESRLEHINHSITVSIIGCVVNGPGEAKNADIGITGGGKGTHQIYISGFPSKILKSKNIVDHVVNLVEKRVEEIEKKNRYFNLHYISFGDIIEKAAISSWNLRSFP